MDNLGSHEEKAVLHGYVALVMASIILAGGILLSPPLKGLREALGMHELPGARYNGWAAEIIDPEQGSLYLARIAFYYHSLFAVLLYGTLAGLVVAFKPRNHNAILGLALLGATMTAAGGLGYAYISRVFYLHGIFIGGLATLFAAGALAAASYKPRDLLGITAYIAGILLLGGGLIGGYVGSSFMNYQLRQDFIHAVIASRYNPDLAEQNEIWRAWTGHQHAMIALVMVITFTAAARLLETPTDKLSKILLYTLPPSTITMAIASYLVWPLGEQAHLAITPAALALILSTTLISWKLKAQQEPDAKALIWTLRAGNLLLWLYVTIPGALIATSLYKPVIYNPPIRDPSMDWMELAFNTGHWHLLLTAWGITLLAIANHIIKISSKPTWLALAGYTISGLGATLYYTLPPKQPYQPNPYNNTWIKLLVEPGLTLLTIGVLTTLILYTKTIAQKAV